MPVDPRPVLDRLRRVLAGEPADPLASSELLTIELSSAHLDPNELAPADHRGGSAGLSRGVLVICVFAVLIAGFLFWRARPVAQELPSSVAALGVAVATPAVELPLPGASPGATAAAVVVVHVIGRVNKPGLVRLAVGARMADAIAAAGGLTKGTDPADVNLARLVVDGEQVDVGAEPVANSGGGASTAAGGGGAAAGVLIDLNAATVEQLDGLPGVGPVLAQRIVDYRTQNGRFTAVDDLRQVSGIGEKKYADLAPLVRV